MNDSSSKHVMGRIGQIKLSVLHNAWVTCSALLTECAKKNDVISWLIDASPNPNVDDITARVLLINFAAIHTSSIVSIMPLYVCYMS
jgi:hypothetical protein